MAANNSRGAFTGQQVTSPFAMFPCWISAMTILRPLPQHTPSHLLLVQRCAVLHRSRSTNSAFTATATAAPARDHNDHHQWVVENDEARQDNRYHDVMQRRAHLCLFRQQHRELFSPAHSFDDVTHFSESINLPYLPLLDEPSTNNDNNGMLDDSNTVRRLPPRCETDNSILVEFFEQQHQSKHHRDDDGNSSAGP
jgi:hypothetical protein